MTALGGPPRDRVVVVLGNRDPDAPGHRISAECVRRVRRAEIAAAAPDVRAVIFSGFAGDGGPSEARQMAGVWRGPRVPEILEERSRTTAENAAESLALILRTMPEVRRVTVVTSSWHIRTPVLFRHYRLHGIEVEMAWAHASPGEWLRHAFAELRGLPHTVGQRQAALRRVGHLPCRAHGGPAAPDRLDPRP